MLAKPNSRKEPLELFQSETEFCDCARFGSGTGKAPGSGGFMRRKKFSLLCAVVSVLWITRVDASDFGKGVLCGDSLQSLVLYEVDAVRQLPPGPTFSDLHTSLGFYAYRLHSFFSLNTEPIDANSHQEYVEKYTKNILAAIKTSFDDRVDDVTLTQPLDSSIAPSGCQIKQILLFEGKRILRDPKLWNQLDNRNKTALELYAYMAKTSSADDGDIDQLIGQVMSGLHMDPLFQPIHGKTRLECEAHGFVKYPNMNVEFVAVDEERNGRSGIGIYFKTFKGDELLNRMSSFLPDTSIGNFVLREGETFTAPITNQKLGNLGQVSITPKFQFQNEYLITVKVPFRVLPSWLVPPSFGSCQFVTAQSLTLTEEERNELWQAQNRLYTR